MAKRAKAKRTGILNRKPISERRLETALRHLRDTGDLAIAARSIRVSQEKFKRAALRKALIRKSEGKWIVAARLHRRMLLYSEGGEALVEVRKPAASQIGKYMSAVREFLRTNKPQFLTEFRGGGVTDVKRKFHPFETRPNTLYRLDSAREAVFEEIYRIVI